MYASHLLHTAYINKNNAKRKQETQNNVLEVSASMYHGICSRREGRHLQLRNCFLTCNGVGLRKSTRVAKGLIQEDKSWPRQLASAINEQASDVLPRMLPTIYELNWPTCLLLPPPPCFLPLRNI